MKLEAEMKEQAVRGTMPKKGRGENGGWGGVPVGAGGGSGGQEVPSSLQSCSILGGGDRG